MALPDTTEELKAHLNAILENPSTTLNVRLVETFTAQLVHVEAPAPTLIPTIVSLVANVLQIVEQDPTPLTILLKRLLQPVPFASLLSLADPKTFLTLLQSPSPAIQSLGLYLLEKAASSSGDVSIVATWNDVCKELVKTVLSADDTGVHEKAELVLLALLQTDLPSLSKTGGVANAGGSGLLWRRIFSDKDIYGAILQICSWNESVESNSIKTRAQSRLLTLIPKIAQMDWGTITAISFPDLVARYSCSAVPSSSLLDFTTIGMAKAQSDVVMWMLQIDYFASLLSTTAPSDRGLNYLLQPKVAKHQEAVGLYLFPHLFTRDHLEISLLEERAAKYCATYAQLFPEHLVSSRASSIVIPRQVIDIMPGFLSADLSRLQQEIDFEGTNLVDLLISHIARRLDVIRNPTVLYNPPSSSLNLLTYLPPDSLISSPTFSADPQKLSPELYDRWITSHTVMSLIPLSPPHPEYLVTIGSLLASSQMLYAYYVTVINNQEYGINTQITIQQNTAPSVSICTCFWIKILATARAPALAAACVAALSVIHSISATTKWDGMMQVLKQPSVMEFILRPPERHTARRVADPESIEYKIAMRKHEIVQALARGVRECGGDTEGNIQVTESQAGNINLEKIELLRRWGRVIMQRARMGLWDREAQPVVGTLEM